MLIHITPLRKYISFNEFRISRRLHEKTTVSKMKRERNGHENNNKKIKALRCDHWLHTNDLQHFSPPGSEDPPRGEGLV